MAPREIPVPRILGVLAAWLLVVATGSWLVWTVISDVGDERAPGLAVPARSAGTPGSSPDAGRPEPTPGTGAPEPGGSRSAPPSTAPSTAPSAPPSAPRSTASSKPSTPSTGPRPGGATSTAAARTLTWSGAAGVVTTRCTGSRIELVGASASADGYVVEVDDRGPARVKVEFEGRGEETVPETRVEARCVGGRPSYDVSSED